jgi:hypothetical protein
MKLEHDHSKCFFLARDRTTRELPPKKAKPCRILIYVRKSEDDDSQTQFVKDMVTFIVSNSGRRSDDGLKILGHVSEIYLE